MFVYVCGSLVSAHCRFNQRLSFILLLACYFAGLGNKQLSQPLISLSLRHGKHTSFSLVSQLFILLFIHPVSQPSIYLTICPYECNGYSSLRLGIRPAPPLLFASASFLHLLCFSSSAFSFQRLRSSSCCSSSLFFSMSNVFFDASTALCGFF